MYIYFLIAKVYKDTGLAESIKVMKTKVKNIEFARVKSASKTIQFAAQQWDVVFVIAGAAVGGLPQCHLHLRLHGPLHWLLRRRGV